MYLLFNLLVFGNEVAVRCVLRQIVNIATHFARKRCCMLTASRTHVWPLSVSDAVVKRRYFKSVYMVAGAIHIGVCLVFEVRVLKSAQGLRV